MTDLQQRVTDVFIEQYGEAPVMIVRAPGRVNLIGEHTDYNEGFVFPMAIDRAIWVALRPRADQCVQIHAIDVDELINFDLNNFDKKPGTAANYVMGVAWALQQAGYALSGWEGVMSGDVPVGAGLSSSAALELAIARAFYEVSAFDWDAARIAQLAQKAENDWLGVRTGIMDQMISASGKTGYALLIDCRDLSTQTVPLPEGVQVVVLDTGTRRGLVDSAYNERREQCEAAAKFFGVEYLRDVSLKTFESRADELDALIRRRAKHIITDNLRVLALRDAMYNDDISAMGKILNAGHISLRDDFEVSSPALDAIVAIAQQQPGCYGARMTGGGFAGCAVALVDSAQVETFVKNMDAQYRQQTGHTPAIYVCQAAQGASDVPVA